MARVRQRDIPETAAEIGSTEKYNEIFKRSKDKFNSKWDNHVESKLLRNATEQQQIREMLNAHMKQVFGRDYIIGLFSERDMGERLSMGYMKLTAGDFPKDGMDRPTFNDGVAQSMKLFIDVDDSIKWGRSRGLYVCVIPRHLREHEKQKQESETERQMTKHGIKTMREQRSKGSLGTSTLDVEVGPEPASASF